jgi:hypothetical protein
MAWLPAPFAVAVLPGSSAKAKDPVPVAEQPLPTENQPPAAAHAA